MRITCLMLHTRPSWKVNYFGKIPEESGKTGLKEPKRLELDEKVVLEYRTLIPLKRNKTFMIYLFSEQGKVFRILFDVFYQYNIQNTK